MNDYLNFGQGTTQGANAFFNTVPQATTGFMPTGVQQLSMPQVVPQQFTPMNQANQMPMFDFLADIGTNLGVPPTTTGMPQSGTLQQPDTGFTSGDYLNFGLGAANTMLGGYLALEQLDQGQQALDLSRDKYENYLAEQSKLDEVGAARAANARTQLGM